MVRPLKHTHRWYPISHKSGDDGTAYDFKRGYSKPRSWKPPADDSPVLWACSTARACTETLTRPEWQRLTNSGKFEEGTRPRF